MTRGLEEKGQEISKLNEDMLDLLNKELNNEVNNVMVPYIEQKLHELRQETVGAIRKENEPILK